ncbi:MAG: phosphomannomutase [Thermoproteota archaeon]|nr:phosphomannomutase [Thermoproteota archaeon]
MKISISGIRGIFNQDLSIQEIARFSRTFGSYLKDNFTVRNCVIARDSRPSGKLIAEVVAGSLLEQGIHVYDMGVAPTPVLFREARKYTGGLMITASHNPLPWNGLKMLINGRGLFESDLEQLLSTKISEHSQIGKYYKIDPTYTIDILKYIQPPKQSKDDFKVGIDFGGGAACNYTHQLLDLYLVKYFGINDNLGFSSRGPDPTSDPLLDLCNLVKINNLNFGFAFDIDGDRLVVVNSDGVQLNPDLTLLFCVASVINNNQFKKFTISLDTSLAVEKYVKDHSGQIFISKVGESNVLQRMIETHSEAGGEGSSGGFIMPSFTSCRDGLLASVIISSLDQNLIKECMTISSNFRQIRTKYPINAKTDNEDLFDKILSALKSYSTNIIYTDGLKFILDDDSWILMRISNTEHVLRMSLESTTEKVDSLYKTFYGKIVEAYEKTQ